MDINQFVLDNNVEKCKNLINIDMIKSIESNIGITFGEELKKYIVEYGYLSYEYIELYGINSIQGLDSDMIKQTLYLYNYFPTTKNYIALANLGDGYYSIVDSNDNVYEYISEEDELINTKLKLFDYIIKIFNEVKLDS